MRSRTSFIRTFVTAIALMLSALMGVGSAAAQVAPVAVQSVIPTPGSTANSEEIPHSAAIDCKSHRGVRNPGDTPGPLVHTLHMCVCHAGPIPGPKYVAAVTGSEAFPRGRSVDLPVLHQVFRC